MKTSFAALALSAPIAAGAQAGSAIDIYGMADAVVGERCAAGCHGARMMTSIAPAARPGPRGRAVSGVSAPTVFTREVAGVSDASASALNGPVLGRQTYVGLDTRWGALTFARQYNLQYDALADVAHPFHAGEAGSPDRQASYAIRRYDSTVEYVSPPLRGVTASAIYTFGESPYSSKYNRAYGLSFGYEKVPFTLRIAHQRKRDLIEGVGSVPLADFSSRNTLAAASIAFSYATVYGAYGHNKGIGSSPWDVENPYGALVLSSPSTRSRDTLIGVAVPTGAATWMVSFTRKNDNSVANQDASQLAAGLTYAMSHRTSVYAAYARVQTSMGSMDALPDSPLDPVRSSSAFNIGLRYNF